MKKKRINAHFAKWVDSLGKDYAESLTVIQILLMQEAWNAALKFERARKGKS
jgi:hypothetical protein